MIAFSVSPPALTSVRISWPRWRLAVITIFVRIAGRRLGGVLDLDDPPLEVEQQPLAHQRVDPDHPVAAKVAFAEGRQLEIADRARAERQRRHLDPIDEVAVGAWR